jgi:hypothetical protein
VAKEIKFKKSMKKEKGEKKMKESPKWVSKR